MKQVPQERLIPANCRQLGDHAAVAFGGARGAKWFRRAYFNPLHNGSTGLSSGGNGGNRSPLSRSLKAASRTRLGSPLGMVPPSQTITNRPARSCNIASRKAVTYQVSKEPSASVWKDNPRRSRRRDRHNAAATETVLRWPPA